jgi:hypothetical protein
MPNAQMPVKKWIGYCGKRLKLKGFVEKTIYIPLSAKKTRV